MKAKLCQNKRKHKFKYFNIISLVHDILGAVNIFAHSFGSSLVYKITFALGNSGYIQFYMP